jgi:hypothetical protein
VVFFEERDDCDIVLLFDGASCLGLDIIVYSFLLRLFSKIRCCQPFEIDERSNGKTVTERDLQTRVDRQQKQLNYGYYKAEILPVIPSTKICVLG